MKQQAVVKGIQQKQYRSEQETLARLWVKAISISSSLLPCSQQGGRAVLFKMTEQNNQWSPPKCFSWT